MGEKPAVASDGGPHDHGTKGDAGEWERGLPFLRMENDLLRRENELLRQVAEELEEAANDDETVRCERARLRQLEQAESDLRWFVRRLGASPVGWLLRLWPGFRVLEDRYGT